MPPTNPESLKTTQLRDGSVTTDKLIENAVSTSKIQPSAVVSSKLAHDAATYDKQINSFKKPVRVATTVGLNIDLITGGLLTIDTITLIEDDRVLVKDQIAPQDNGIYVAHVTSWIRAVDFDADNEVEQSSLVFVKQGVINASSCWVLDTPDPIAIGTTGLTFNAWNGGSGNSSPGIGRFVLNGDLSALVLPETEFDGVWVASSNGVLVRAWSYARVRGSAGSTIFRLYRKPLFGPDVIIGTYTSPFTDIAPRNYTIGLNLSLGDKVYAELVAIDTDGIEDLTIEVVTTLGTGIVSGTEVKNETPAPGVAPDEFVTVNPFSLNTTQLYYNGLKQKLGLDYNEVAPNILKYTFVPPPGNMVVDYSLMVSTIEIKNEIPVGPIGPATDFTTVNPFVTGTTQLYLNGERQMIGTDYAEIALNLLSFTVAPLPGADIVVDYEKV